MMPPVLSYATVVGWKRAVSVREKVVPVSGLTRSRLLALAATARISVGPVGSGTPLGEGPAMSMKVLKLLVAATKVPSPLRVETL